MVCRVRTSVVPPPRVKAKTRASSASSYFVVVDVHRSKIGNPALRAPARGERGFDCSLAPPTVHGRVDLVGANPL